MQKVQGIKFRQEIPSNTVVGKNHDGGRTGTITFQETEGKVQPGEGGKISDDRQIWVFKFNTDGSR